MRKNIVVVQRIFFIQIDFFSISDAKVLKCMQQSQYIVDKNVKNVDKYWCLGGI
jgi:hypothetical protein